MKIGQLSREGATKVTTIRFYESIGLLDEPARTSAGWRVYPPAAADRLNFIRNGRRLGFSVDEIRSLLALTDDPEGDCTKATQIAARHLSDVDERLKTLTELRNELASLSRLGCSGQRLADCQIIMTIRG